MAAMLIRRFIFSFFQAAALVASTNDCHAMADASAKIRELYDTLLNTMKDSTSLGAAGRYQKLEPVIGRTFDLPYMARAVVGPRWANAPEIQQRQMIDAFAHYITATYAARFESYSGQQLRVLGEERRADAMIVDSEIVRADAKSVTIKYLMRRIDEDWRVADIYVDGTISELATRRSEFSSIVQQQGVGGLATILQQKADALTSGASGNQSRTNR